jgi:hypothetical protein
MPQKNIWSSIRALPSITRLTPRNRSRTPPDFTVTLPEIKRFLCGGSVDTILDFTNPVIKGMSLFHCHLLNHEDKRNDDKDSVQIRMPQCD